MKKKTIIIGVATVAVATLAAFFLIKGNGGKEVQYNTVQVNEQTIEVEVTATGYVQPVDQVEVGTQVSGVVERIFVDYNSQVTKGQLLAEIDKSNLNENLSQARAGLTSAESELRYATQNYERVKKLYDVKAATEASFEEAVNRLTQAETSLDKAKANVHQAQVNLSYAEIYSPIDGVILDRSVEQGQTVAASFNTPTLFTIANDLTRMQVEADVDEADIGRVKTGQAVDFTVDAYSDDTFEGVVNQIRLQPVVTNNVVTYTVIIEAPNPEEKLFPGMTASVAIITDAATGLSVPAEALNFTPTPELLKRMNVAAVDKPAGKAVWVKTAEGAVRREVTTGLSDGIRLIAITGLSAGDEVILSATIGRKASGQEQAAASFMPGPPRR